MKGKNSSQVNTDILARKWTFIYFHRFGLHSFRSGEFYQIFLLLLLVFNYVAVNYIYLIGKRKFDTLAFTSFCEALMISLAVGVSQASTISGHVRKQTLLQSISDADELIKRSLSHRMNLNKNLKDSGNKFIIFWSMSISFALLLIFFKPHSMTVNELYFDVQLATLNHITHMQSLQIFIFLNGIVRRLQVINEELKSFQSSSKVEPRKLFNVKKAFIKLYDINHDLNKSYRLQLLFLLMHYYSTLVLNCFWFGIAVMRLHNASIKEAIALLVPAGLMVFYLGHIDSGFKRLHREIITSLTSTPSMKFQGKELLLLLHRCSFSTECFKLIDTSNATLGKMILTVLGFLVILFQFELSHGH